MDGDLVFLSKTGMNVGKEKAVKRKLHVSLSY